MLDDFYKMLKSGTDIRGTAVSGVEGEEVNLTNEVVEKIAYGFVLWLKENINIEDELTISVGHDSRISAEILKKVMIDTFIKSGIKVKDCGLSSTPAMFMTTIDYGCDAAVQITASHHPFNKNGFKFFVKTGGLNAEDIESILKHAQNGETVSTEAFGSVEEVQYMNIYAETLRNKICEEVNDDDYSRPLRGFKIVVDAGNGAGGFYANKVLAPLGADITGSQFLEPDGMFPNHVPNPEDSTAMSYISKATVENEADLGIIFDTDVDRAACVDETGKEINRNRLIALASCIALDGNEGGTIVTDSVTSGGLKDFLENHLGARHLRYKRGYKNVINEAVRLNRECSVNAPLAIETSGHAAMRENYFLDDGAYLITKIIIKMAQLAKQDETINNLIESLSEPVEAKEARIKILAEDFRAYGNQVIKELEEAAEKNEIYHVAEDSYEGVRISTDKENGNGWFLLRLSVHDPILPLNIESESEGGVSIIAKKIYNFLSRYKDLDLSALEKLL